ncbi:hypothetical protein CsatB_019041 [Cannabis sativa]
MNTQEKKKKEEGNALFKAGKYERASKTYKKIISKQIYHKTEDELEELDVDRFLSKIEGSFHIQLQDEVTFIIVEMVVFEEIFMIEIDFPPKADH